MTTVLTNRGCLGRTVEAFRQLVVDNLYHTHGQAIPTASKHDVYMALSYAVRDYLIERCATSRSQTFGSNSRCGA